MNLERLNILWAHLKYGDLGHKVFDFNCYNDGGEPNKCGSAGCALGECPVVWEEWLFDKNNSPVLKDSQSSMGSTFLSFPCAREWFDIAWDEADHLFNPYSQHTEYFGGKELSGLATRYEVADQIEAFVDYCYVEAK